jgi:nitrogen fixation protein NifU and related proteins
VDYSNKVLEHFTKPRNAGKIRDADGVGLVGDPMCGDYLRIYIKVEGELLVDIKFEVYGCPAAIATGSVFTELAKGKPLEEAMEISDQDIVDALGGLPESKIHCSNIVTSALNEAVLDYITRPAREVRAAHPVKSN